MNDYEKIKKYDEIKSKFYSNEINEEDFIKLTNVIADSYDLKVMGEKVKLMAKNAIEDKRCKETKSYLGHNMNRPFYFVEEPDENDYELED